MFSEMGNEYRGSVCGETRWSTTPFLTADLETTTWDPHYNCLQDVPDSATANFMDSNLPINYSQDWTQSIIFNSNSNSSGEKNSQSQILNQELTHDSQDPSTFFLDQIHTPANNITYGLFSQQQQQPIYENPQYHPAADDQLSNSPYNPSIFSGQDPPMTMWTDHHFFPSSTPAIKSKKKNSNADQQPLISKRPRIETPSPLPTFKVRKEKMGDRITALQQLVSPFGKTDTASVLHEAIDYIKFLHDQVHALSNPYLKNGNPNMIQHRACMQMNEKIMDLKSRGLCLVPISSTFPVASETTADFWTPRAFSR